MNLVLSGGNDQLLMMYVTLPELYTNCPEAVHQNIDLFKKQNYMIYGSLFMNIARMKPSCLITHIEYFVTQLITNTQTGTLTLMTLECIAKRIRMLFNHISHK